VIGCVTISSNVLAAGEKLTVYDLAICKAFAYKVSTQTTDHDWPKTYYAFPQELLLPLLNWICAHVAFLSGFKPELYDCCPNSCICYTGPRESLQICPYCKET
jgi:hypothetical protein